MACPAAMFLIFSNSSRSQPCQVAPAGNDLAYRRMEEGANAIPPPLIGMSDAARNCISIAFRCLATAIGVAMLAYLCVARFVYHVPEVQDPSVMLLLAAIALGVIGVGHLPTLAKYCDET